MKLTKPQHRILTDAVRTGKMRVGGRNMVAVDNLEAAGLITVEWCIEHGGQQDRWDGTVRPTDAGKDLIYS